MQGEAGRPDRADPPRAQAVHDHGGVADGCGDTEYGAGSREHGAFADKRSADGGWREADRRQQTHLAGALFEADGEEQVRQQQCRDHQEEAEVEEVLAEVRGSLRGRACFGANRAGGKAGRRGWNGLR